MTRVPEILPIFPLTGSLLLPGGLLPLHIFEPRYCAMVEDALEDHQMIGMVQPRVPDPSDNQGPEEGEDPSEGETPIYRVGCAGRIEEHQALPYGRFVVVLRGIGRFEVRREIDSKRGYRRVQADTESFLADGLETEIDIEGEPILEALGRFAQSRGIEVDLEHLEGLSGLALLNGLAMNLPFQPAEKQALLEAGTVNERRDMLLTLMVMGFDSGSDLAN